MFTTPPRKTRATPTLSPSSFSFIRTFSGLSPDPSRYTPMSETSQSNQLIDCKSPLTDTSSTSSTPYNILSKNSEGQWEIVKAEEPDVQVFPIGEFEYVVMANGEIRVQCSTRPISHSQLASGTPVLSAGQLFFSEEGTQELQWWNNNSVDYPSETVNENIGLPLEDFDKFVSDDEDTDNEEVATAFEQTHPSF